MKINELTKFAMTLGLLPWIPAILLYKHSHQDYAVILLAVFLLLSLICFISKKFAKNSNCLDKLESNVLPKVELQSLQIRVEVFNLPPIEFNKICSTVLFSSVIYFPHK